MSSAAALRPLLAELESNARLRWGLWAIVGIVWFYGVLVLRDEVPRQGDAYRAVARQRANTQAAASDLQWSARRDEALAAQAQIEARIWRANTLGLAQASLHDWLAQALSQAGAQRTQITVAAQDEEAARAAALPGMWKVTARVSFDFTPEAFYSLMAKVAAHDKKIVVESVQIRTGPPPRSEMVLVAYFLGSPATNRAGNLPPAGKS